MVLLIGSLSLVATFTISVGSLGTSRLITGFLETAEVEQVGRDMTLAQTFYQNKLVDIAAISYHLADNPWIIDQLSLLPEGNEISLENINTAIKQEMSNPAYGCASMIMVVDADGYIFTGRAQTDNEQIIIPPGGGGIGISFLSLSPHYQKKMPFLQQKLFHWNTLIRLGWQTRPKSR